MKENRTQAKEIRELEQKVKAEIEKSRNIPGTACPMGKKTGGMVEYDYNIQKVKRAQKVQKVSLHLHEFSSVVFCLLRFLNVKMRTLCCLRFEKTGKI